MGYPATLYSSPDTKKKCLPLSSVRKGGGGGLFIKFERKWLGPKITLHKSLRRHQIHPRSPFLRIISNECSNYIITKNICYVRMIQILFTTSALLRGNWHGFTGISWHEIASSTTGKNLKEIPVPRIFSPRKFMCDNDVIRGRCISTFLSEKTSLCCTFISQTYIFPKGTSDKICPSSFINTWS